jgi:tol-pal system protein YbgF
MFAFKNKFGPFKARWFILSLLLIPSCVTTQEDTRYLNDQIVALNNRVGRLENTLDVDPSSDLNSKLKAIRESQAEIVSEFDKVKQEVEKLSGRFEVNQQLAKRTVEKDTTEQDAVKAGLADLNNRIAELEKDTKKVKEYLRLEVPPGATQQGQITSPTEAEKPAQQPAVPKEKPISPDKLLYDNTYAIYQEGKYEEAIEGFKDFLKKYPESDLADNAQFWIGECYMSLKQFEKAILSYQEVIKNYPKGNKVANAMIRQALAFYEIKDKTSSRLLLKKVIKQYPNSDEAKIAETKLKTMK